MTDTAKPTPLEQYPDSVIERDRECTQIYEATGLTPRQLLERVKELTGQSEFQHHQKKDMKMTETTHYSSAIGFRSEESYIVLRESIIDGVAFHCFFASKNGIFNESTATGAGVTLPENDIIVLAGSQETADRVLREIMKSDNV